LLRLRQALDEQHLIARFRSGDRAAFDILYKQYAGSLLAFSLQLTQGSRSDAEDLVQETFIAAFESADRFRGGSRLSTWLIAIALRRFRDRQRRSQPIVIALDDDHAMRLSDPSCCVEASAIDGIRYQEALTALSDPLRIPFLLVVTQGLTHREAARILETPVGTIKWRVAEATKRLRATLSEEEKDISYVPSISSR